MAIEGKRISELDNRHLWHPNTQHRSILENPLPVIVSGKGSTVVDQNGKEYLDALGGLWCINIGYGRQEVADAAYEQMKKLAYYPLLQTVETAVELAEKVASLLPGSLNRLFIVSSGSEAVETALKIARQCQRQRFPRENRFKFISRYRGYHGFTFGGMSVGGIHTRRTPYEPLVPGVVHANPPYCYRCDFGQTYPGCNMECARQIETIIRMENPQTVAAVICEPIVGAGGIIVPPEEYYPMVREICNRFNVLLIFDEVITGFGRTGEPFGCILFGVVPDMVTMAKGISSAYLPLAACATTDEVFEEFLGEEDEGRAFASVSTFGGHAAACAAGVANLEIFTRERLWERAREVGTHLLNQLKPLEKIGIVGDVRGKGLVIGVEIVTDKTEKTPASPALMRKINSRLKEEGLIIGPFGNVVCISPPLVLTAEEADRIASTLEKVLSQLAKEIA